MNKLIRVLGSVFAFIGFLTVVLIVSGLFLPSDRACTGYPVMSLSSPDGQYRVEQMQEMCTNEKELKTSLCLTGKDHPDTRYGLFGV
jgi:hypothetical protein